ncbi:MAG: type IV pilus twitching motility protein PilT [Candidatus Levybacteria bacterium]|nr:type IV pilus twitching motility protein PilT [Candidatus Levybacteria bacterium]
MDIQELLTLTIKNKASDLHLLVGLPPTFRIDGALRYLTTYPALKNEDLESMIFSIVSPEQKELLLSNKELDFSFGYKGKTPQDVGRFRINAYFQKGTMSAALRFLAPGVRTLEELGHPKICHEFSKMKQGMVLVTGPTGHGKSSTLAAILNEINMTKSCHILTIEDPIEYVYPKGNSIISQREMGIDTHSWAMALRSSLREDPDVVLIGEMRDPETMSAAITLAETGHLVLSTLHTNSASQSIDRIVDAFSADQRSQIRIQLAATLKGIVSQRLIPKIGGGRVPAVEILLGTPAVAANIRDGKSHLIDSVIQTSKDLGMITIDESLSVLVKNGVVTMDDAKLYALRENELIRLVG